MSDKQSTRKYSIWSILSGCSLGCSFFTIYKGIDKMSNYHNSENYPSLNVNAYVGGDAYNYIINGTYATSFFVLTAMFVLAAIGLMILHYISRTQEVPYLHRTQKDELDDIESNLPKM